MGVGAIFGAVAVVAVFGFVGYNMYISHVNNVNYNACCRDWFDQSDSATTPAQKIVFLDKYIEGLRNTGLDKGVNSVFDSGRPNAQNSVQFQKVLDLRAELVKWNNTDPSKDQISSLNYNQLGQKITWTDYCWFPDHAFRQAYQLQHGNSLAALYPPEQINHCAPKTSTSSTTGSSNGIGAILNNR